MTVNIPGGAGQTPNNPPKTASDQSCTLLELEYFTQSQIFKSSIACPTGMRISDMFNNARSELKDKRTEFIEVKNVENADNLANQPKNVCIKKSSILFALVSDENLGRGIGAASSSKMYPYLAKTAIRLNIQLQEYLIIGNILRTKSQNNIDVLNDETSFLPMTDVVITKDGQYFRSGPFITINKAQILSLIEE
jgi:hypothetical protein